MAKNRVLILVIILAAISATVIGFVIANHLQSQPIPQAPATITLNMVGYTYTTVQMQPLILDYEKTHPLITINYTQLDQSSYAQYLLDRFHAGNTAVAPDIYEAANTDRNEFIKYTHLAPANILSSDTFKKEYYKLYDRGMLYTIGDKQYVFGIPQNAQPLLLAYNKRYFTKDNISIANMTTDVNSFNSAIASLGKKYTAFPIIPIGGPGTVTRASDILQLFMLENGTQMSDNAGKAAFSSAQASQALSYYNAFVNGDFKDNWVSDSSPQSDITQFAKEESLLAFIYPSDIPAILSINPSMQLGFAVYPSLTVPTDIAHYTYDTVYAKSANSTAAWNFLTYLTQDISYQKLNELVTPVQPLGIIYPKSTLAPKTPYTDLNQALTTILPVSFDWNIPTMAKTTEIFNLLLSNYLQGSNAQQELDSAQQAVNTAIQKQSTL